MQAPAAAMMSDSGEEERPIIFEELAFVSSSLSFFWEKNIIQE